MEAGRSLETSAHNARGLENCHVRYAMVTDIIHVQIVMAEVTLVTVIIASTQAIIPLAILVKTATIIRLGVNLHALIVKEKNMSLSHVTIQIVIMVLFIAKSVIM